jgi:polysaccharide export outer membrane protein
MSSLRASILQLPILFATAFLFIAGCAEQTAEPLSMDPAETRALTTLKQVNNIRYRILAGDEIEIKLTYHPQYNERLEVLPDGWISLPIVNDIEAAGKEPGELAQELKEAYSRELRDPEVVVMVRQSKGRLIYVGGEVRNPQAVALTFPLTLLQAVIRCGDISSMAHGSNVLILRPASGGSPPQALVVDLSAIRAGKAPDVPLEPYDVVHVPKTVIAHVGDFIDAYINRILPKGVSFPFTYEIHSDVDL